jgi:hypothetical protein
VISRAFFLFLLHKHFIKKKSFSSDVNNEANFPLFFLLHKRAQHTQPAPPPLPSLSTHLSTHTSHTAQPIHPYLTYHPPIHPYLPPIPPIHPFLKPTHRKKQWSKAWHRLRLRLQPAYCIASRAAQRTARMQPAHAQRSAPRECNQPARCALYRIPCSAPHRPTHRIPCIAAHRANATSPRAAHCIANNPRTVQRTARTGNQPAAHRPKAFGFINPVLPRTTHLAPAAPSTRFAVLCAGFVWFVEKTVLSGQTSIINTHTSPHRPRLVVSRSTCPPISPPPHVNSFVLGPAVINTHYFLYIRVVLKNGWVGWVGGV